MNFVVNILGIRSSIISMASPGSCFRPDHTGLGGGTGSQVTHPPPSQQNKMEDHLDEAIHVLRSHAVGTSGDVHGLLPSHGTLASGFAGPIMPLGGRHTSLVSAGQGGARWAVGGSLANPDSPTPDLQVGGSHSEDGLSGSGSLMHNHVALPNQPSALPDLSRPPDSYSGKSQHRAWAGQPAPQSHLCSGSFYDAQSLGITSCGKRVAERVCDRLQQPGWAECLFSAGLGTIPPPFPVEETEAQWELGKFYEWRLGRCGYCQAPGVLERGAESPPIFQKQGGAQ